MTSSKGRKIPGHPQQNVSSIVEEEYYRNEDCPDHTEKHHDRITKLL